MELDDFLYTAEKWDAKYRKVVISALREYQPERAGAIIQRYLSRERQAEFNMVNTYSRAIFRRELLPITLEANLIREGVALMLGTFTPFEWAHCDRDIQFDYADAKSTLRNAFPGMNFLGVIEPAYYPKVKWQRDERVGKLISFHAHVLVWDTSETKLRRHQRELRSRFKPVDPGDRGTPMFNLLKTIKDLAKVVRYATKMPYEGYDKKKKENAAGSGDSHNSTSVKQSHLELEPIYHYRLFKFLRKHKLFAAWLAGGDGAELLRRTRKAALRTARGV